MTLPAAILFLLYVQHLAATAQLQKFLSLYLATMRPFAVFCCSENENRSFLISALDIYRIRTPTCTIKEETRRALWEHLCMKQQIKNAQDVHFAAQVDTHK